MKMDFKPGIEFVRKHAAIYEQTLAVQTKLGVSLRRYVEQQWLVECDGPLPEDCIAAIEGHDAALDKQRDRLGIAPPVGTNQEL